MKVHLVGAAGAGATTLGQALSETLGVPYFDTDAYFWLPTQPPFTQRRAATTRNALLTHDLSQQPSYVLGGSLVGWGDEWPTAFDLVVFLWLPPALRLHRLRHREHERHGNGSNPARAAQTEAFLTWAAGYDDGSAGGHRTFANHMAWLARCSSPVLELRGDLTVAERQHRVLAKLRALRLAGP